MKATNGTRWMVLAGLAGIAVLAIATDALANQAGQKNPAEFMTSAKAQAATAWDWLVMAGSLIVGGGSLASGGRALFKGDYTSGSIGIGFGVGVLLLLWALGGYFGYNAA